MTWKCQPPIHLSLEHCTKHSLHPLWVLCFRYKIIARLFTARTRIGPDRTGMLCLPPRRNTARSQEGVRERVVAQTFACARAAKSRHLYIYITRVRRFLPKKQKIGHTFFFNSLFVRKTSLSLSLSVFFPPPPPPSPSGYLRMPSPLANDDDDDDDDSLGRKKGGGGV